MHEVVEKKNGWTIWWQYASNHKFQTFRSMKTYFRKI